MPGPGASTEELRAGVRAALPEVERIRDAQLRAMRTAGLLARHPA